MDSPTLPPVLPGSITAEMIAIGTELLMGEVVNSNAAYLSKAMAALGIDIYYHSTVGDNPARIQTVFQTALSRSNILLVTGGLGPTEDDLTVATLAQLFSVDLVCDPLSEDRIRQFFIARDMPMSSTNLKQALRPDSAVAIENPVGTAPGLFWDVSALVAERGWGDGPRLIFCFPGVPREMIAMWEQFAQPRLQAYQPDTSVLVTRFLKFVGIGESMLAEKLADLMALAVPTVSPYVGQAEVKVRIAAKAAALDQAESMIAPVEAEILKRTGHYCYGKDEETLESVVGNLLRQRSETIAVAESCTGGLLSSRLTDVPGSSAYVRLNVVTYSNAAKTQLLDVSQESLTAHGAVSREVASEMATGVLALSCSDMALSITGIAGPSGGSPEKPVGLAYIGLARSGCPPQTRKVLVNPRYSRDYIKYWFSQYALNLARLFLTEALDPEDRD